jgi:hypothetical protein
VDVVGKVIELAFVSKLVLVSVSFSEPSGHFSWSLLEEFSSELNELVLWDSLIRIANCNSLIFELLPFKRRFELTVLLTVIVSFTCSFSNMRSASCPECSLSIGTSCAGST